MEQSAYETLAVLEPTHWYYTHRRRVVAALLARHELSAAPRILDIGAGTGGTTAFLASFGDVVGVEPSPVARSLAARRYPAIAMEDAQVETLERFRDRRFDVVSLFTVLYHRSVAEPERALDAAVSRLQSGGLLLWQEPIDDRLVGPYDDMSHGARRFDFAWMRQAVAARGLRESFAARLFAWAYPMARLTASSRSAAAQSVRPPSPLVAAACEALCRLEWRLLRAGITPPVGISGMVAAVAP